MLLGDDATSTNRPSSTRQVNVGASLDFDAVNTLVIAEGFEVHPGSRGQFPCRRTLHRREHNHCKWRNVAMVNCRMSNS